MAQALPGGPPPLRGAGGRGSAPAASKPLMLPPPGRARGAMGGVGTGGEGAALEATGVRKLFGGLVVLDGVDMRLEAGRVHQLIGPNGSGKTTLINVISGALRADGGSVRLAGEEITGLPMLEVNRRGLVRTFQTPQSFAMLTARENVLVATGKNRGESYRRAPLRRLWRGDEEGAMRRAGEALSASGLAEKASERSDSLSGGQRKLLELAKARVGGARVILMDEPIAGVNPTLAHRIFGDIRDMAARDGTTFLVIEHRLDISLAYADRVFAMDSGRIVAEGTAEEVMANRRVEEAYLGR